MRPWRFHLIPDHAREEFLDLWLAALERMAPDTPPRKIATKRKAYASPPVAIVVGVKLQKIDKVPETEQMIATGCAVQNLLNAAHAMGFGAILLSGKATRDETLKKSFGFESDDYLVGVIYVGTSKIRPPAPEINTEGRVFEWPGSS